VNGEECVRASAGRRPGRSGRRLSMGLSRSAARDKGGHEVPPTRPLGWESARDGSRTCTHRSLWKRRGVAQALAVAVGFEQSDLRSAKAGAQLPPIGCPPARPQPKRLLREYRVRGGLRLPAKGTVPR
jgi:hypothetical protein